MNTHYKLLTALALLLLAAPAAYPRTPTVCFEAESAQSLHAPFEVVTEPAGATRRDPAQIPSGNAYLEIAEGKGSPPENDDGEAVFPFAVREAGVYVLWCRVWWADECANSFTMHVDAAPPFTFGQDPTFRRWHWVKAPSGLEQLDLSPGEHTLTVRNREDGVRLDQILLVRNRRYVPVNIEDVTGAK